MGGGGLAILRLIKFRTLFYFLVVTTDHAGWFSSRAHGSLPANSCSWAETLVHVVVQRILSLPRCVLQSFCACRLLFSLGKIEQPFVLVLRHIVFFFFGFEFQGTCKIRPSQVYRNFHDTIACGEKKLDCLMTERVREKGRRETGESGTSSNRTCSFRGGLYVFHKQKMARDCNCAQPESGMIAGNSS